MKPIMLFALIALTAIVLASSFGLQLDSTEAIKIPANMIGQELYVCPADNSLWTGIAQMLHPAIKYITIAFFFVIMLLMFNWGWALYQNLLSDSFKRESFSKPWQFTKFTFWMGVVVLLLTFTPNYFRTVKIDGVSGEWVLCENNTPGAKAEKAEAVHK